MPVLVSTCEYHTPYRSRKRARVRLRDHESRQARYCPKCQAGMRMNIWACPDCGWFHIGHQWPWLAR